MADAYEIGVIKIGTDLGKTFQEMERFFATLEDGQKKVDKISGQISGAINGIGTGVDLSSLKKEIEGLMNGLKSATTDMQRSLRSIDIGDLSKLSKPLDEINTSVKTISENLTRYTNELNSVGTKDAGKNFDKMAEDIEKILSGMSQSIESSTAKATENLTTLLNNLGDSDSKRKAVKSFKELTDGLKALNTIKWDLPKDQIDAFKRSLTDISNITVPDKFADLSEKMGKFKHLSDASDAVKAIAKMNVASSEGKSTIEEFKASMTSLFSEFSGDRIKTINDVADALNNLKASLNKLDFSGLASGLKTLSDLGTEGGTSARNALESFANNFTVSKVEPSLAKIIKLIGDVGVAFEQVNKAEKWQQIVISGFKNVTAELTRDVDAMDNAIAKRDQTYQNGLSNTTSMTRETMSLLAQVSSSMVDSIQLPLEESLQNISDLVGVFQESLTGTNEADKKIPSLNKSLYNLNVLIKSLNESMKFLIDNVTLILINFSELSTGLDMSGVVKQFAELRATSKSAGKTMVDSVVRDELVNRYEDIRKAVNGVEDANEKAGTSASNTSKMFQALNGNLKVFLDENGLTDSAHKVIGALDDVVQKIKSASVEIKSITVTQKRLENAGKVADVFVSAAAGATAMTEKIKEAKAQFDRVKASIDETNKSIDPLISKFMNFEQATINTQNLQASVDAVHKIMTDLQNLYRLQSGDLTALDKIGEENIKAKLDGASAQLVDTFKSFLQANGSITAVVSAYRDLANVANETVTALKKMDSISTSVASLFNVFTNFSNNAIPILQQAFEHGIEGSVLAFLTQLNSAGEGVENLTQKLSGTSMKSLADTLNDAFESLADAKNAENGLTKPGDELSDDYTQAYEIAAQFLSSIEYIADSLSDLKERLGTEGFGKIFQDLNDAMSGLDPKNVKDSGTAFQKLSVSLNGLPEQVKQFTEAIKLPDGDTTISLLTKLQQIVESLGNGTADITALSQTLTALSQSLAKVAGFIDQMSKSESMVKMDELMRGIDVQSLLPFINALGSLVETETKQESTGNKFAASIREITSLLEPLKVTANDLFHQKDKGSDEYVQALTNWKTAMEGVRVKAVELQAAMSSENVDTKQIEKVIAYIEKAMTAMSNGNSSQINFTNMGKVLEQLSAANPDIIERTVTGIRMLGEVNVKNISDIARALQEIAQTDLTVHLNEEQIAKFTEAMNRLADDKALKSLQKTVQNLRPLLKDMFNGIADSESISKMNDALANMDRTLQSIFNITPDSNQLMVLGDELAAISTILDGGLFKTGDDNKKIPYLAYLEKFDTTKIDEIINKMSKLASGASIGGLSKKLTTISEAIKSIGASLGQVKGTNLSEIMNAMSQNVMAISQKDVSGKFDELVQAIGKINTVKLDTKQFTKLRDAIKDTTKAITDFVNSLSKMTPGQLDNLLENIITIANATGNTTAQAAAQTKQKYDEMKGNLETAKHAITGMMKGDEATFKTYSDEFLNAMVAVDEYIKSINRADGGYHNLKAEEEIIRHFKQLWTDATAAIDAYQKKQDEIKAKERQKTSEGYITRNAQDANTRVAQIKAIAGELGKLESKDGTQFSSMETQFKGLTEAMEKWHRSTTRTKETEAVWAAYQAALVKVNSEMNRLNDAEAARAQQEKDAEEAQKKANAALAERIKKLRETNQLYDSMSEATKGAISGIGEYDTKDTMEAGSDDPIQRIVTYYEEGVGKVRKVIRQIKDAEGEIFYYIDPESSTANKYNENAYVSEVVKQYQAIFEARAKLATLGDSDTQQREKLQAEIQAAAQLLLTYKQTNPELLTLARSTEDYAKAKKKAEDAESKRGDKSTTKQNAEDQRNLNALLKRQYEIRKEIQDLEIGLDGTKNKNTAESIQSRITKLKQDEADVSKEISNYAQRGVTNTQLEEQYQRKLTDEKDRSLLKDKQSRDVQDQILSRMMSMVRNVIVMRVLRQVWTEAIKYAQEYYDKMNEIQIVTMKSSTEIAQLSAQYKTMAQELKISSTDIATAAVEFWRQGLDSTEVAERTKWTSQYAKITGQSFDQAATLVTASTNSMQVSAQEAVDLFTYLGDASASSGEEIGTAMQKSAAAASAFGLDFKKLGAYIATVSEKTRQEASSIGTAFNTIIARWHSIKKTGYVTNDDGTTTASNDITKALSETVGINLLDTTTGQWRDMGIVMDEIAAKWSGLSAAQKSYIATTMAGTKQQNVFLALMEDMALGAEGGSRMYELYAGALDSAGTVAEKYAVYLDSVTAAQEGMKVSLQELYDVIMSGDTLKTFYNTMADLSHLMASGLQTGLAQGVIKFTALAGAIGTVVFVVKKLKDLFLALQGAKGLSGIMTVLSGGKLMLAVGAIAAVVAGVVALAGAYKDAHDEAKKLQDLQTRQQKISTDYTSLNALKNEYTALISIANRTEEENARLKQVWEKIQSFSPTLAIALSNVSGGMEDQTGVTEALNGELERLAENYKNVAIASSTLSVSQIMDQHNASISAIKSSQAMANYRDDLNAFALSDAWSDIAAEMENGGYEAANVLMSTVLMQNEKKLLSIFDQAGWADSFESMDDFVNFANLNPEVVDNVVGGYVDDLIQAINQAWSDAQKESGTEINFSDFIIQSLKNATDDNAIDKQYRETAQTLYDNFFNVLRPMNWSSMSVGEQSIFTDAFEAMFNFDNFGDYFNGFNGTPIDYIIGAMAGGEDEVNKMFMRLLIGAQEYATRSSEWKDGWAKAYSDTVDAFKNDDIDNDTAYNALLETYRNMKSQYGDAFFVDMPSRQEFEDIASGVSQIGSSADEASESVETLSQKLKKVLDQQTNNNTLKALENSNFKDWFYQLNSILTNAGGDSEALAKGIYGFLGDGKTEDQIKKFLEIFPEFTKFFSAAADMGDANDFSGASESLEGYADTLAYFSDQLIAAYEIYKESKSGVTDDEGNGFIQQLADLFGGNIDTEDMWSLVSEFHDMYSALNSEQKQWLMNNSDGVNQMVSAWTKYKAAAIIANNTAEGTEAHTKAIEDMAIALDEATTATKNLRRESQKITFEKLENGQKVWDGFSDLIENADGKSKDFSDTYGKMIDRVGDMMTAMDALAYIQSGATNDADMLKNAYSDLASYCGVSADALASDLSPALWALQSDTAMAETTMANLVGTIFDMSGIAFDPSNMLASLQAIANDSDNTYAALANLAIKMISLSNATIGVQDGRVVVSIPNSGSAGGYTRRKTSSGRGSSGGGGSSSNKDKSKSEEERFVEETEKIIKRITDTMSQLKTIMGSWGDQGYLTAQIDALYEMNGLLEDQDKILREKIAEAQKRLPGLISELNGTTPETEEYDKVLKRVNEIQDAIVEWTQQLTENEAEIISNNEQIKDLRDSIRQLEIDLENEVLQAIEDREERINNMLQARIDMEETILEILKAQAEDAEQAILDAIDAQIEALNREKDAISEILDARKEQADAEDKLTKLQQLQAKYARIIADPTRAKEASSIMEEINNLRDEIAWDQAENESEAQQSSIDQQISSLEDYRDYIEQYYEDLLNNPRNFIEQVNDILKMTQEDILMWLEQNSDEYKNSSDNTRIDLVNGWTDTLNTMNGIIDTHWKEVQEIISQGDEYVINFLKENSAEYREASKLQQEAYIEGWQEMFDNIRKAYEKMQADLLDTSKFVNAVESGVSGSSGGSGGSGGAGGKKKQYKATYPSIGSVSGGTLLGYATEAEALNAAKEKIRSICRQLAGSSSSMVGQWATSLYPKIQVSAYKKGGLNTQTGLAWLDGTKTDPERILNATQTKLFDSLVASLEEMNRIRVAPMRYTGDVSTGKSYGYNFGDINIKVEKLDSDRDLEDMAEKVKEAIVNSMTRGRSVGGITL